MLSQRDLVPTRAWRVFVKGMEMQEMMKTLALMMAMWIGLFVVTAAPAMAGGTFSGSGIVNEIKVEKGKVNISHEPIPELSWPGMTMDFSLAKAVSVEDVKVGEAVEFELRKLADGSFVIESIGPKAKSGHSHGH